ncbi:MAG: DUF4412 domain-containing protein [Nitrospira sp.]|nr:DUF4412 domain-containing protein [Nitrospira sp.]MDH4251047.1 DUF4412 domain-containing protein [Nitrospira sp.]MDH4343209.1 DUF4412 domain-containing protein [Nitrospira sp.]MDH5335852.1 DUF4412 domain-containing protein [Nitrospira sp.]
MKRLRDAGLLTCVLLVPLAVSAAPPPEVQVDYSADSTMETEGGMTMKSRVYHTVNKDRMEMGGSDGMTSIVRKDKKVVWQLMGDMYMEMPMDASNASGMEGFDIVEQAEVGQETINGIKATKSKIVAVKKDGSGKFGGFFWTTKEGITVKMDMLSKDGDKKMRMTSELTNLKIEKQSPALFEIPAGYTKNDMGAMMGMGSMPNMEELKKNSRQRQSGGKQPRESQAGESLGEQIPDVNKMMKGLFGK